MSTSTGAIDDRAAAERLYRGEGLDLPPLPAEFAGCWRQAGATAFATRPLAHGLYAFRRFREESVAGVAPYAAFGFDGHGFMSQAAHYYVMTPRYGLLLQLRWGSMTDAAGDRSRYRAFMIEARLLDRAVSDAVRSGAFPEDRRLIVAGSTFDDWRWAWVPASGAEDGKVDWKRTGETVLVVDAISAFWKKMN